MEYVVASEGVRLSVLVPGGIAQCFPGGESSEAYAKWVGVFASEVVKGVSREAGGESDVRIFGGTCGTVGGCLLLGDGESGKVDSGSRAEFDRASVELGSCIPAASAGGVGESGTRQFVAVEAVGGSGGERVVPSPVERVQVSSVAGGKSQCPSEIVQPVSDSLGRGKNWERNQRWKAEKKRQKLARRSRKLSAAVTAENWNAEKLVGNHVSFFASCPLEVQAKLRETRAELLIARNQHDTVAVQRKTRELQSDVKLVADTLKVLKLQADFEAARTKVNDVKVGGWAKTVLTDASVSMIEEARSRGSSVPSLESVGVKDSVSQSGPSGSMTAMEKELRLTQYKLAVSEAERKFNDSPYFLREDLDADLAAIKAEYRDVAYDDTERALRDAGEKLVEALGTRINNDLLEEMMNVGLLERQPLFY